MIIAVRTVAYTYTRIRTHRRREEKHPLPSQLIKQRTRAGRHGNSLDAYPEGAAYLASHRRGKLAIAIGEVSEEGEEEEETKKRMRTSGGSFGLLEDRRSVLLERIDRRCSR